MTKRRKKTAGRLPALLLCAVLCLSLAACRGGEEDVGDHEGNTFTIAVSQRPDTLNPAVSEGGLTEEFFLLCYDPLWRINAAGQPEPCLAEDWSLSSDKLTWTIRLRHDALFSDGEPVTARDVLFSYELMRRSALYGDYFDGVTAIRCPDDHTVVISTQYVKSDMTYNPAPILPEHIWKDYEFSPGDFENAAMTGSGPFIYDAEQSGEGGWLFRSRSDYFGGRAQVGAVLFSYYGTVTGAARALAAGEADASFGLTDVQLTTMEGVPDVELIEAMLPKAECRALVFNTRDGFFADAQMRRIIEYCSDRAWFLSMSSGGAGLTGSSFMSPGSDAFAVPSGLREFDMDSARAALFAAGYADSDGDGVLEAPVARRTRLRLTLVTSSLDEWASTAAAILTADMEELGISVDWQKTDSPITEVCGPDGDWDMCMCSWQGSQSAVAAADSFMLRIGELSGWSDPSFDSALDELRVAADEDSAYSRARQVQQLVYDACPVVVLSYGADIQGVRSDAWTGYEEIMNASGGLFGIGSAAVYMGVAPVERD